MNRQQQGTFLPDFCNARTVFVIIMLAELLAIIISLSEQPYEFVEIVDLALNSLFVQWVALSSTGILCIFRGKLRLYNDHWVATISYGITLVITFIVSEIAWHVLNQEMNFNYFTSTHTVFIFRVMGISAIVWALALRYFYVQHQWRLRIQSESEARFQALQSRIKPHFFFNCMNTIASLIRRNPELAEESVEDLADLFRASLQESQNAGTLADEITLCKRYLRIEQHRLGERLQVNWNLDQAPMDVGIPVLCIQPLIENAIYHGIEPNPDGGIINIDAETRNKTIVITIRNPVDYRYKKSLTSRSGNKLAQENVRQRLASYFDRENLLTVEETQERYTVTIKIPIRP